MTPFVRSVTAKVDGLTIDVVNHWYKGCTLLVNRVEVARNDAKLALTQDHPLIEVTVDAPSGPLHLDVRMLAIFFAQIELHANGHFLAGSRLVKEQEK